MPVAEVQGLPDAFHGHLVVRDSMGVLCVKVPLSLQFSHAQLDFVGPVCLHLHIITHQAERGDSVPKTTKIKYGGDLETLVATHGTVILDVDHANESYAINVMHDFNPADLDEIEEYLADHGFEIMDDAECPPEHRDFGMRFWAAHKEGKQFGFVETELPVKVTLAGMAVAVAVLLVQWLSAPTGVITEGLIFP